VDAGACPDVLVGAWLLSASTELPTAGVEAADARVRANVNTGAEA
jgi:hypothetical protein